MTSDLRKLFPALGDFSVTSPPDGRYNCIAWAAGTDSRWWEPVPDHYWPSEAPLENNVAAFVAAFSILGYQPCADGFLEAGFEKVAIYQRSSMVSHMARQLPTGRWTSKIGQLADIEHASPAELEGAENGAVVQCMRRAILTDTHP